MNQVFEEVITTKWCGEIEKLRIKNDISIRRLDMSYMVDTLSLCSVHV